MPEVVAHHAVHTYPFLLNGAPVHITVVRVPMDKFPAALLGVSEAIAPERYYAHFILDEMLYVSFPGVICSIRKGDGLAMQTAKAIGTMFRIPMEQMPFEGLFTEDHPGGI